MSESKPTAGTAPAVTLSRRLALAVGAVAPFLIRDAQAEPSRDGAVADLVERSERQAQLFNSGQMEAWVELVKLGEGFTLMQPFGGPASHGFDASPEHLAELSARFRNGDASLELVQTLASDNLVVVVYVERQDGEVHGLPKQDWSLRVTQVFQRFGAEWQLMHRHADPLVRRISLEQAAALAAGRDLAVAQAKRG